MSKRKINKTIKKKDMFATLNKTQFFFLTSKYDMLDHKDVIKKVLHQGPTSIITSQAPHDPY